MKKFKKPKYASFSILCTILLLVTFCGCATRENTDWNILYERNKAIDYLYSESASKVLKFSNIELENNISYTVCTGYITNNGNQTYYYVKIKGSFTDYSGTVVDTDWTYAVGSEGLEPGETKKFRMSVEKNNDIKQCSISIIDFNT